MKTKSFPLILMLFIISCVSCVENDPPLDPPIKYPSVGDYGINLLAMDQDTVPKGQISIAAVLGEDARLKIKITALDSKIWGYTIHSVKNWSISKFDQKKHEQIFEANKDNTNCDLEVFFFSNKLKIEYFEMGAIEPSKVKILGD